jgi:hypothetical protein
MIVRVRATLKFSHNDSTKARQLNERLQRTYDTLEEHYKNGTRPSEAETPPSCLYHALADEAGISYDELAAFKSLPVPRLSDIGMIEHEAVLGFTDVKPPPVRLLKLFVAAGWSVRGHYQRDGQLNEGDVVAWKLSTVDGVLSVRKLIAVEETVALNQQHNPQEQWKEKLG